VQLSDELDGPGMSWMPGSDLSPQALDRIVRALA